MNEFKRWLENVKNFSKEEIKDLEKTFTFEEFKSLENEFKDWYNNYTPKIVANDC